MATLSACNSGGDQQNNNGSPADAGSQDATSFPDAAVVVNPNALFVSTQGDNGNDGLSEATALRTIAYAAQIVKPGETIYVAAGDYGAEQVVFTNQGTEAAPIAIEGYHLTPGDRPRRQGFDHSSALDPEQMPLLDGNDRSTGLAIELYNREYITVRNLQITRYATGVSTYESNHLTIADLVVTTLGINDEAAYSGQGIIIGSRTQNSLVYNSVVVNAGAEAIMIQGNDNRVAKCSVYSYVGGDNANSTDYYLDIYGDNNIVEDSSISRVGEQEHVGHGIGIKEKGTGNLIRRNVADGFSGAAFYVRHRGVVNNTFSNNTARNGGFAMLIRDGASDNLIEGLIAEDTEYGIGFLDTDEDEGRQFTGNDNTIRNSQFTRMRIAVIVLHDYIYNDAYARRNTFTNLSVDGAPALFDVRSYGEGNLLSDSDIQNVASFAVATAPRNIDDLGFSLNNNTGSGNGFAMP